MRIYCYIPVAKLPQFLAATSNWERERLLRTSPQLMASRDEVILGFLEGDVPGYDAIPLPAQKEESK